ncbi:Xyloglucan galactosyltransferase xlt2 [Turnera subulata]|uniref:Xyloglucan galactosyltransferase xlt2 n=1 Tax=Turnera subulata TaxID=218843 RepID=A0A9Q0FI31_9ROSI|nr:Xyloglucan galactosyltransferase xlt2 [Turnera subulata]
MLPLSKPSSPEPHIRKPKSPPNDALEEQHHHQRPLLHRKNSFSSLITHSYNNQPRACLFLSILSLQILLLLAFRSVPASFIHLRHRFPAVADDRLIAPAPSDDQCGSGRVYVYDLPASLNRDIVRDCDELNPWSSRCDALENDGFGQEATGISGIVPEGLAPAWYWTDQFVTEVIFHNRILNHKCRTTEPSNATAFYIPFYAGLAVGKFLWTNSSARERDQHCRMMIKWLQEQPYFKESNGWDHFLTMGRISWDFRRSKDQDWGSSCIYLPGMRNITRLLIERNPWDYFDVGAPYPTGFHPRSDADVVQWQDFVRSRNRSTLFCFAGAPRAGFRNDFRGLLLNHCNESDSCRVVNCAGTRCSNGTSAILETFLDSDFCLQPRGDSFTRRSIFDCMLAGSIPVLFWRRSAYYQYEWFLPGEPESYSVFIDRNGVKNGTVSIQEVLRRYSKEEVRKMREKVISYIPKFVYARPHEGLETIKDAFDVALDGVLRRIKEQGEWDYKW